MSYSNAIVVGSGVGGLMTARVLSDHFDHVTLIDRDSIPEAPGIRKGAPQGNHFHAILPGGLGIMNGLFPGFDKDLEDMGSLVPEPHQFYIFGPEGKSYNLMRFQPEPAAPPPDWPRTHVQTRGLLEHCIRQRVEAIRNIDTRYDTLVRDLLVNNGRIAGVRIDGSGEELMADLVIDATGKASRTLGWMEELGYQRPKESHVHCDFAYSTVLFKPRDPAAFTDVAFFMQARPESDYPTRGGALARMEDGSLLATVFGRLGDHPPRDLEGFMAFAGTLIEPWFHELISDAEPIKAPHHFKFPKSIRRHYEQLDSFPEGLIPIADAICHYNPLYGQGMSAASRTACALGELIGERRAKGQSIDGLWRDYFPAAYQQTRAPWLFAALSDFQNAGTEGDFPAEEQKTIETMMKLVGMAGEGNREAAYVLGRIQTMQAPLSTLDEQETLERFELLQE
jgi:2-polyprenyl-6-methoxyphenol hydroxylase-like FAD-dependent oxidoreductase